MVNMQEQKEEEKENDEKIRPSCIVLRIVLSNELCGPKVKLRKDLLFRYLPLFFNFLLQAKTQF